MNLYGLFVSLGILAAYRLTAHRAWRRGLSVDLVWDSLPWVLVGGLVGARLYHVINYFPFYIDHLSLVPQVWRGGLGILGGLGGGLIGLWLFLKSRNYITIRSVIYASLDCAAPGIALAQAVGRVGNVVNGELMPYAGWELTADIIIFILLLTIERFLNSKSEYLIPKEIQNLKVKNQNDRLKVKNGNLFFLYLLCYSITRFLLEFFRTDSPWVAGPLTVAQWVSLVVAAVSFGWALTNRAGIRPACRQAGIRA